MQEFDLNFQKSMKIFPVSHTSFMDKFNCKNMDKDDLLNNFFECADCGNHVCQNPSRNMGQSLPPLLRQALPY